MKRVARILRASGVFISTFGLCGTFVLFWTDSSASGLTFLVLFLLGLLIGIVGKFIERFIQEK